MPVNVHGNSSSSHDNGNKIDTSIIVQKLYLRTKYVEANIEEDLDTKNQLKFKNLPCPIESLDAVCEFYVDSIFNKDSDFNDKKLRNMKFVKVNYQPAVDEDLTPKLYVDNAIDESSFVRNNQDKNSYNFNLTAINSITLKTQAVNDNQVIS